MCERLRLYVSRCVGAYWEQKKRMCDAEPEAVRFSRMPALLHCSTAPLQPRAVARSWGCTRV